jgi:trans-2,3-dihydro-3-hydroxyanthranilate isomerase
VSEHPYTLLDVFSGKRLAGNQLAVVHDADGVPGVVMLRFARETRLNETTFVQTPSAPEASYRNRIWTMTEELPFAGHPSLGTAFAVALRRGETAVTYVQQTPAGLQPVDVRRDGLRGSASVLAEPPEFGPEVDPGPVLEALGLRAEDAHPELPVQFVSTGLQALIIPVRDAETVSRARPDRTAVERLHDRDCNFYLCFHDAGEARARSFPRAEAEDEDPATGSAAANLVAYLHARVGSERVEITQGVEILRPSRLVAEWEGDRPRVSGEVVVVAEGLVRLPSH